MEKSSRGFWKGFLRGKLLSILGIALVVTLVFLFLSSGPALALFGFGIRAGVDNYKVSAFEGKFIFPPLSADSVSLKREEIDLPLLFGAYFTFDLLPIVDLELSADLAMRRYNIIYKNSNASSSYPFPGELPPIPVPGLTHQEVTFARLSLCGTLKKNLIKIPPVLGVVSLYAGVGAGVHLISPVISKTLILDKLSGPDDVLTPQDVLEDVTKVGGHALVGIRVKPPLSPFAFNLEGRYTALTEEAKYEEPERFLSVYAGLSFGL